MSSLIVRQTFDAFVQAQVPWEFRIIENANPKPPVDGVGRLLPFVGALYVGNEQANSIGAPEQRCFREYGSAMAVFFAPSNTGSDAVIQTIENFRKVARGQIWGTLPDPALVLEIESVNPASEFAALRWGHSLGDFFTRVAVCTYRFDFKA